jgi:hypothetical protein
LTIHIVMNSVSMLNFSSPLGEEHRTTLAPRLSCRARFLTTRSICACRLGSIAKFTRKRLSSQQSNCENQGSHFSWTKWQPPRWLQVCRFRH